LAEHKCVIDDLIESDLRAAARMRFSGSEASTVVNFSGFRQAVEKSREVVHRSSRRTGTGSPSFEFWLVWIQSSDNLAQVEALAF
jgi:hypothetical protein